VVAVETTWGDLAMAAKAVQHRVLALTAASLVLITGLVGAVRLGGASGEAKPNAGGSASGQVAASRTIGHQSAVRRGIATSCRVIPASSPRAGVRPLLVVVGASFTAGAGAPGPADGWAVRLAKLIRWRAVTLGVPGVGYTRQGVDHLGPLSRLLDRLHLAALHPALVIIQAGHDDRRVPAAVEAEHVADLVGRLRIEAPAARLVFLTVFSPYAASPATLTAEAATDSTIVSAIRKSDPRAIVIDPLRSRWHFARAADGLHPTARGGLLIAERVARALIRAGVPATSASHPSPARVTCTVVPGSVRDTPALAGSRHGAHLAPGRHGLGH
jgi:lysophospholipase L1-like esterase